MSGGGSDPSKRALAALEAAVAEARLFVKRAEAIRRRVERTDTWSGSVTADGFGTCLMGTLDEYIWSAARALYDEGMKMEDIAGLVGRDQATVSRRLRKSGVQPKRQAKVAATERLSSDELSSIRALLAQLAEDGR